MGSGVGDVAAGDEVELLALEVLGVPPAPRPSARLSVPRAAAT